MECEVLTNSGQTVQCEVLTDSGQTVQCEVLTESGQTVKCEVLTVDRLHSVRYWQRVERLYSVSTDRQCTVYSVRY